MSFLLSSTNAEQINGIEDANKSFQIMMEMLYKHFSPWENNFLYFGSFTEKELGKLVAKVKMSTAPSVDTTLSCIDTTLSWGVNSDNTPGVNAAPPPVNNLFKSAEQQQHIIDLQKFEAFVRERCTMMETINEKDKGKNHQSAVQMIAQGHDIWEEGDLPESLAIYQRKYILELASFPTTTQAAERAVKHSNFCSNSNHEEVSRSVYAVAKAEITKSKTYLNITKINV